MSADGAGAPLTAADLDAATGKLLNACKAERDQARADLARAERERGQARAALRRLAEWCQRGEFATQAVLAHAHGFRASPESLAEAEAVWADVRAALAAPGAGGEQEGNG